MESLNTVGGNARADKIAKALGYSSAEQLKGEYVAYGAVSKYDMKYDVRTKEIVLENHQTGETVHTNLYIPDGI